MAQESIQDEIKELERKLQEKRRALGDNIEGQTERDLVKDIIKESAEARAEVPTDMPSGLNPPVPPPAPQNDDDASMKAKHDNEEKEHSEIVEHLIADALSNGLAHALRAAEALRNPHILDDFHDTLADKYYEKLLESRKLKR